MHNDQFQLPLTSTVLALNSINFSPLTEGVATNVFTETEDDEPFYDDDFVVRPHYTREFEIKVGTINIDRSLPKIFID